MVIFGVFVAVFLWFLNLNFPLLGQDYFYFFPRILSGNWHFANAGLVPFRYDPHFCGGLSHYGNPQDVSFSLLQLLSMTMDLWTAAQVSMLVMLMIGYAGWYRVGRDLLRLEKSWAHTFALIISASGYYLLHMLIGHLTFHTTPLLGWFLWLLFNEHAHSKRMMLMRASHFALLCTFILHAGGYFVLMQGVLLALLFAPFAFATAQRPAHLALQLPVSGLLALLCCASKLTAVASYMRFFPRHLPFNAYIGEDPLALFIAKSFWMMPQIRFVDGSPPYRFGLHEFSMHQSPVTLLGLLLLPWLLWKIRHMFSGKQWTLFTAGTLLVVILTYGFARGEGLIAGALHDLPLLSSWRMNMRFLYVAGIFIAMAGTYGAALTAKYIYPKRSFVIATAASCITVLSFLIAHRSMLSPQYFDLQLPYPQVREGIDQSGYRTKPVTAVEDYTGQQISDFQYILAGTTGKTCYEILLTGIDFLPDLKPGPVHAVTDRAFMMNNPACLQYPEINGCVPGARIAADDRENFEHFVSGKQPQWKLPWWQKAADAITILTLLLCVGFVGWRAWKKWK